MNFDLAGYHGFDGTLEPGTSLILSGPSNCGKTTFAVNLIRHRKVVYNTEISKIIIITPHNQPIFDTLKETEDVDIINDVPDYEDISNMADLHQGGGLIIFLDDIMQELSSKANLSKIFTQLCHHKQLTCILSVQNLFFQSNEYKNMVLNCSYLCLFKVPGDKRQISTIGGRMFPGKSGKFISAFEKATEKPYSYLFIDYRQKTRNFMRLKKDILPTDKHAMGVHIDDDE